MKYLNEIFLSKSIRTDCQAIVGKEATEYLNRQGLSFIHVDDNGKIFAMAKKYKYLDGMYLYKRRVAKV